MLFVTARDFRIRPGDVWKTLQKEKDLVVTINGKPTAILSSINEESLEATLVALQRIRAALALERLQEEAIKSGASEITDEEIEAEIRAVRSRRRQ